MVLKHVYKFLDPPPIKWWSLCPFPLNLGRWAFVTASINSMWQNYAPWLLELFVKVMHILLVSLGTLTLGTSRGSLLTLGPHVERPHRKWEMPKEPQLLQPQQQQSESSQPRTRHVSEETFKMTPAQPLSVCLQTHELSQARTAWSTHRFISKINGGYCFKPLLWAVCSRATDN